MKKYTIIGNMTGNSMDAIDLVVTEFCGSKMHDICTFSTPFSKTMRQQMDRLRRQVKNKTQNEIKKLPLFHRVHDTYIHLIATAIRKMCRLNHIAVDKIDAIGFHGKTLDHYPPSVAKLHHKKAYTLQMGSGQMLANLTHIPVIYDFRSDFIMHGFDGAPLIGPHNANVAKIEGDGCYYNGGNTSNFTWIIHGKSIASSDAGPCNEYADQIAQYFWQIPCDLDGKVGSTGKLNHPLFTYLFQLNQDCYQLPLPKSGDPQFYQTKKVINFVKKQNILPQDALYTAEYFAAYIALYTLTLDLAQSNLPNTFLLFGGGWKNPVILRSFKNLLHQTGYIFPQHKLKFQKFLRRLSATPKVRYSKYGTFMEARLCADLARYKLDDKAWPVPETQKAHQNIICGKIAHPNNQKQYTDQINRAAKGWK